MTWINENKEWFFSGVGLFVLGLIGGILKFLYSKIKKEKNNKSKIVKNNYKFEDQVYWKTNDINKENPFCPNCLDSSNLEIHLLKATPNYNNFQCPNCKTKITNELINPVKAVLIKGNMKEINRKKF